MTAQVVTQAGIEPWATETSLAVVTQAGIEPWASEASALTATQVGIEFWASPTPFVPPAAPCQAEWPPGAVVWVSQGIACWDSNAPSPSPSGCVMGMTLTSSAPDFAIVSATILAQQYTLRV